MIWISPSLSILFATHLFIYFSENPERNDNSFKKLNLLIYNKARDNFDISLRCKYAPNSDKNFKVILGGLTKLSNNVDCKGKVKINSLI